MTVATNRKAPAGLSEEEALPVRVAQALLRDHQVSDDLFNAAHAKFGNAGVVELLGTVGYYASWVASSTASPSSRPPTPHSYRSSPPAPDRRSAMPGASAVARPANFGTRRRRRPVAGWSWMFSFVGRRVDGQF